MELIVVGSGAAYPDRPGVASSCYLVRMDGATICLDLGQGAFAGVAGRMEPADLLAVVVSHLHPDHFVDLVALRHYLRYELIPPGRVRVVGPEGLAARLDGLLGEVDFAAGTLLLEPRQEGELEIGPFRLESRRVTHTANSFAVRLTPVDDGRAAAGLVYSGDCGRADDLVPLIRPGDTLLTEVAFGPGPVPAAELHLDGPAVGRLAAATMPGRVLLTHLQMRRDAAATLASVRAAYAGPVALVQDGDATDV